jgi:gliding motility-associated-like protein
MRRLLLVIALFLSSVCNAQTDTVFWFALPPTPDPGRFVFHTYDQPADITISQPGNPYMPVTSFTMVAHDHTIYTVSSTEYFNSVTDPYNTVLNRGYRITSTVPITCYYQITTAQRETFTLKGRNALGTDFQVLTPLPYRLSAEGQSITMIATEDSTHVLIVAPRWVNRGNIAMLDSIGLGDTVAVTLNSGQSYAIQSPPEAYGFMKAKIHASQPIAISFSDNAMRSRTSASHSNPAGEQLIPLTHWGMEYVRINGFTSSDLFRATDYIDTGVYRIWPGGGGNSGGMDWNVGWANFFDSVHYFRSERPLGMTHQLAPNDLMAATVVPHLVGSGSHQISYLHADSTSLAIHMVIPTRAVGDVLFNGNPSILTADCFRPVPQKPEFSWCNKDVSSYVPWDSVMTVSCSVDKFLLAVIETDSLRGTAYTYLSDYAPAEYVRFDMDTAYCEYDSITFIYRINQADSVALHCPDGHTITRPPFFILHADSTAEGAYIIEAFDTDRNIVYTDSIYIHIHPRSVTEYNDTVLESQLPWNRFGILFYTETDTTIQRPDPLSMCDSLIIYHLHIYDTIHDTVLYYTCKSELPIQYGDSLFYHEGAGTFHFSGSHGEDSIVTFILNIIPSSDTTICDSITEDQLPWFAMDTVFYDTVADYIVRTYNEAGCDSIIHYCLYIFWNGDHCDTALSYPNVVTPNGDGVNDRFVIGGLLENNCFHYNELFIYDRTGRCVYHKTNISDPDDWWNPSAHRIPSDTYFFYFRAHGVTLRTQHIGVIEVLQ